MLIELFANIGLSMIGFLRGMPDELRVKSNIEKLRSEVWFQHMYDSNYEMMAKDESVRYLIGWLNVEKTLKSQKKTDRFKRKLTDAINGQ